MPMYDRTLEKEIETRLHTGKAIVLIGPRQVGKTTLIKSILSNKNYLFLDGDEPQTRRLLSEPNTAEIQKILSTYDYVFIDEVQRIEGIGLTMKIITDQCKDVQLFASGSSSFYVSSAINESLTGRKWEYQLFPITWEEYENHHGYWPAEQSLEQRLLYGMYPDVLNNPGSEVTALRNLVDSYLYKDILSFKNIRKPKVLDKLVQALAYQIGNEVNYSELANMLSVDKNTVSNYIEILEEGYIIFTLGSFSRNLRNEIKRNQKIYFYDNGIRNMILGNFDSLSIRSDKGALWENFLIAERLKQNSYKESLARAYFWRTKQQQEVDFVEEQAGRVVGYKFKWQAKKQHRLPKTFVNTYQAESHIIDRSNFRDFVIL